MIGFVFGTACLAALFALARRSGWARGAHVYGYGGHGPFGAPHFAGWTPPFAGGCAGPRGGAPFGFRGGPLDVLFERLDTSPEQERVLRDAIGEARRRGRAAGDALRDARRELAAVLRGEHLDEVALGAALAATDQAYDGAKRAALDAAVKVHGALDARQRGVLADAVEGGARAFFRRRRARFEV